MSVHNVNNDNESSFDIIEEIADDEEGIGASVALVPSLPGTAESSDSTDVAEIVPLTSSSSSRNVSGAVGDSEVNRSNKSSIKSQSQGKSPTHLPASASLTASPSTSKGAPVVGPSMIVNNFLEVSSDTSSAAGFKVRSGGTVISPLASPSHHQSKSSPLKSGTPEIEPIPNNEDPSAVANSSMLPDPHITVLRSPVISAASNAATSNIDYLLSLLPPAELNGMPVDDPIVIRGNGNLTLFGLSNSFTNSFPSSLLGRVSREEFEFTMNRINSMLRAQHTTNAKLLLLGCLCCCCSLGCTLLWPTFALSKRTRASLEKVIY